MARHVKTGTRVSINYSKGPRRTPFDIGSGRQAADHGQSGTILEDGRIGPDAGWDVYDVRLDDGRETFAYGFNLRPAPKKQKKLSASRHHAVMKVKIPDSGYVIAPHGGDYVQAFRTGGGALGDSDALKKARRAAEALAEKSRIAVDIVRVGARGQDRYLVEEVYPHEWSQKTYRASGSSHHATKKSKPELDREVTEALSKLRSKNFKLGLHKGYGGEWWIWRTTARGDIVDTIGPFRSRERADEARINLLLADSKVR